MEQLKIPKIHSDDESCSSGSTESVEHDDGIHIDRDSNRLTTFVRSEYYSFLMKVIDENYKEWSQTQHSYSEKSIPEDEITKCAMRLEERAVKCSIVVPLYRKAMLRIISEVRRETTCGKLISKLKQKHNQFKDLKKGKVNKSKQQQELVSDMNDKLQQSRSPLGHVQLNDNLDHVVGNYTPTIKPGMPYTLSPNNQMTPKAENRLPLNSISPTESNVSIFDQRTNRNNVNKRQFKQYQNPQGDFAAKDQISRKVVYEIAENSIKEQTYSVDLRLDEESNINIQNTHLNGGLEAILQNDFNIAMQDEQALRLTPMDGSYSDDLFSQRNCEDSKRIFPYTNEAFLNKSQDNNNLFKSNVPTADHTLNEHEHGDDMMDQDISQQCDGTNSNHDLNAVHVRNEVENEQTKLKTDPSLTEMRFEFMSLQGKIKNFEDMLNEEDTKRMAQKRKRSPVKIRTSHRKLSSPIPVSPASSTSSDDELNTSKDSITKDLENLFGEEDNNELDDIFGDGSYNPQIEIILREIEKSDLPGSEKNSAKKTVSKSKTKEKKTMSYKLEPIVSDMRDSLWPCELNMWKQRLRETLGQIVEVDIRQHEHVRERFRELFGEDSEDEFEPYSPSLELDEIMISSCMKRIAPTIVKYLMVPLKRGLIADRYLFKKLAKRLAYNIVQDNQYADAEYIKERVEIVFALNRKIQSIADIEVA